MSVSVSDSRKELVEMIISNMQKGHILTTAEWDRSLFRPQNPETGVIYKGANRLRLGLAATLQKFDDPRWMTFKQLQRNGYLLEKGARGIRCERYIFEDTRKDEHGKIVKDAQGNTIMDALPRPIVKQFIVFNVCQIKDFPPLPVTQIETPILSLADDLIAISECPIYEVAGEKAFYSPKLDEIYLPARYAFKDDISFTKTLLHEMSHASGHASRLNRSMQGEFGSKNYAREELCAELGALFIESDLNVHLDSEHINDHSNYLRSWIEVLQDDPNVFFKAAAAAEKIAQRIVSRYQTLQPSLKQGATIEEKKPKVRTR